MVHVSLRLDRVGLNLDWVATALVLTAFINGPHGLYLAAGPTHRRRFMTQRRAVLSTISIPRRASDCMCRFSSGSSWYLSPTYSWAAIRKFFWSRPW